MVEGVMLLLLTARLLLQVLVSQSALKTTLSFLYNVEHSQSFGVASEATEFIDTPLSKLLWPSTCMSVVPDFLLTSVILLIEIRAARNVLWAEEHFTR